MQNSDIIKVFITICNLLPLLLAGQTGSIGGLVTHNGQPLPLVSIELTGTGRGTVTDSAGLFSFRNLQAGVYRLQAGAAGMQYLNRKVVLRPGEDQRLTLELENSITRGEEAVVTGTLRPVHRLESPVPVEVISSKLFKKNASVCLFEAMTMVNGVQPQINCNVCNTGDIHINGMEGPYTLVLIDGMPIVSSLATVYGLNGIPNSIVERVELVKGPAASLYGSEAMGGIINVITKNPQKAPSFAADIMASSWQELNTDLAFKWKAGSAAALLGINYFNYQQPHDKNSDGFTDLTQQNRVSVFNKWSWQRPQNRLASLAGRYVYEDRWGGQLNWDKQWRGSDSIYGEHIDTRRWELTGMYQLPMRQRVITQWSLNGHYQDSYYGNTPYKASQHIFFGQAYWAQGYGRHQLLSGVSFRHTLYDDNSPATAAADGLKNRPAVTPLPGFFVQDEWTINSKHTILTGYRFDHDRNHGAIHSPRLAWKWRPAPNHTIRASFGTGFRVVNLFTEDHAALTGARNVIIEETLQPERSINSNLNYVCNTHAGSTLLNLDATAFYTRFSNKIVGDFDADPNSIIYRNLNGHAVSAGISLNTDWVLPNGLKIMNGVSYMQVYQRSRLNGTEQRQRQLFAPVWSGTATISQPFSRKWTADLTAKWNGPMRLPILPDDFRPEYSPWFAIINLQVTHKISDRFEWYGGVKNLLNFVPRDPIMRPWDPFDKQVNDPVNNPYNYTFDPGYNYAPLQGIRFFAGLRVQVK